MYALRHPVETNVLQSLPTSSKYQSAIHSLVNGTRRDEGAFLNSISLTAYENRMSKLSQSFLASDLSFRYHLGIEKDHHLEEVILSGDLMFKGLPGVYALEKAAQDAVQEMFGSACVDFRPLSGVHAMITTLATVTESNDLIYSINPLNGGHFATKQIIERMGRRSAYLPWDMNNFSVDLEEFSRLLQEKAPKAIFLDLGAMLFSLPIAELRQLVGDRVLIIYDASHPLGLIAGGQFQDPLAEGCDILQGNTHKTFPGPQKAMIQFKDQEFGDRIIKSISSGLVSSQHTHHAIALYLTALEMYEFGTAYAKQTIINAQVLGRTLSELGINVVHKQGVHTNSNILLLTATNSLSAYDICQKLMACGISTNARNLYGQTMLRIGSQELTRRGMKEQEMKTIATFFKRSLLDLEDSDSVKADVQELNQQFPNIHYSFDREFGYWQ